MPISSISEATKGGNGADADQSEASALRGAGPVSLKGHWWPQSGVDFWK